MRPNVVLVGSMYAAEAEELLEQHADVRRVDDSDRAAVLEALADAHGLVARYPARIDRELLAAAPNLIAVLSSGRGVDNIDIEAATEAGVVVANNPGLGGKPVSEHFFGLLLMVTRNLAAIHRHGNRAAWGRAGWAATASSSPARPWASSASATSAAGPPGAPTAAS